MTDDVANGESLSSGTWFTVASAESLTGSNGGECGEGLMEMLGVTDGEVGTRTAASDDNDEGGVGAAVDVCAPTAG